MRGEELCSSLPTYRSTSTLLTRSEPRTRMLAYAYIICTASILENSKVESSKFESRDFSAEKPSTLDADGLH